MSQDPKLTPPPQPGMYAPPDARAKKHTGRNIAIMVGAAFLLVIVVAAITSGGQPTSPIAPAGGVTTGQQQPAGAPPATSAAPAVHHVQYQLTGTGGATHASVTWNSDGGTSISQEQNASLPWTKSFDVPAGKFSVATLSGQNAGSSGKVTCTITVDGKPVKTADGSGAYAIAACSGTIEGF